ncbi:squamosa promoter-binding-like protein 12 [Carex littledalei]|uniref:Squamosa promoter-binding-like protein 12 n=1 Tax=Carex littledalei TaxID=544730 RepID=A0A833VLH3_9POAL|nr:squamosa promoter-binding-like protein 12 [Carex littledalei]
MEWIAKPVALWDWDNPPPSPAILSSAGEDVSDEPPTSVETNTNGSTVVDSQPPQPQLGLGLGKRTYFEGGKKGEKGEKRAKEGAIQVQSTKCQVEGCGMDLSSAKDYHRKHRVCENHSKCPRVVVAGQERRFCQQCSRFHALTEFDQKKRSCRRRLSDHNARRRKPQPDTFSFGSTRLSSPFYDERRQISFMWNKAPFGLMSPVANSSWEGLSSSDLKFSNSNGKEVWMKPANGKGAEATATAASNLDGAPDLRRALSLLSSPTATTTPPPRPAWPAGSPELHFSDHNTPCNSNSNQTVTLAATSLPNNNSPFWFNDTHPPLHLPFSLHNATGGLQFQEFQLLKPAAPYETAAFFDSSQIH